MSTHQEWLEYIEKLKRLEFHYEINLIGLPNWVVKGTIRHNKKIIEWAQAQAEIINKLEQEESDNNTANKLNKIVL